MRDDGRSIQKAIDSGARGGSRVGHIDPAWPNLERRVARSLQPRLAQYFATVRRANVVPFHLAADYGSSCGSA